MSTPSDIMSGLMRMPPSTDPADYARLMRQYDLSQAATQMALTPPQVQQPQGSNRGFYTAARVSPLSGFAKLGEAMLAKQGFDQASTGLAQMYGQGVANTPLPPGFADPNAGGAPAGAPASGGAAPAPSPAGAPLTQTPGQQIGPTAGAAPPSGAPTAPIQTTTSGLTDTVRWQMYRLSMQDPAKWMSIMQGTPEYQNALIMAHGDPNLAARFMQMKQLPESVQTSLFAHNGDPTAVAQNLTALETKARLIEARGNNTLFDPATQTAVVMPNDSTFYTGDPLRGSLEAHPIPGAKEIAANTAGLTAATTSANTPQQVPGTQGPIFIQPPLNPVLNPVGLTVPGSPQAAAAAAAARPTPPAQPPSTPPAAPQAPPRAVAPPGSPPGLPAAPTPPPPRAPKSYLGPPPAIPAAPAASANRPASKAELAYQETAGSGAATFDTALATQAAAATETRRFLAEQANLATQATPSAANTIKLNLGRFMIAAGASPKAVSNTFGVDVGALEAGNSTSIQAAEALKGKVDFDTYLQSNPNFANTPGGFQRMIQWTDAHMKDVISKQQAWATQTGPGGALASVPVERQPGAFTANWNKQVNADIDAGKTNSGGLAEPKVYPPILPAHIAYLKAHPELAPAFKAKFGPAAQQYVP